MSNNFKMNRPLSISEESTHFKLNVCALENREFCCKLSIMPEYISGNISSLTRNCRQRIIELCKFNVYQ